MSTSYMKTLFRHIAIWTFALAFWTLMREFGQEVVRSYEPLRINGQITTLLVLGLSAGILFGSLEYVYEKYIFRNMAFGKAVFLGSMGYAAVIVLIIALAVIIFTSLADESYSRTQYRNLLLSKQTLLLTFFFITVGTFTNLFREIDKKFGHGNLWKMFRGEFYSPKEEHRIFLFLDLKSSTATAELLGHFKYSKLLQDCFKDLAVVENHKAEIYQYVGDEAVLTWHLEEGLKDNHCINAFYAFKQRLEDRKTHYIDTYGMLPEFKAGLHMGKVVTAEVGELKREIAHHGDTINTAARIQEKCNDIEKEFLISEEAKNLLSDSVNMKYHDQWAVLLKGKRKIIKIFSVERLSKADNEVI